MKNTKEMLGRRIKELRKGAGLSQLQLSEKVGIESKYLSRIEVGSSFPSADKLEDIAQALNVELKDLFDFSHLEAREIGKKDIEELLEGMSQEKLRLIYKIVKSVVK
jgi:transcriptional regulator with XRE-family HTH domain